MKTGRGPVEWFSAEPRAILPLDQFRASHSLRKRVHRGDYEIRFDTAFAEVIGRCSQPRPGHPETWINDQIIDVFCRAHEAGLAHSVEAWGVLKPDDRRKRAVDALAADESTQHSKNQAAAHPSASATPTHRRSSTGGHCAAALDRAEPQLLGGLYGLALAGAFFGESMFSRSTDASKIAFVHLVKQLQYWEFGLIDCQVKTRHLASLGAREISRVSFSRQLGTLINDIAIGDKWNFERMLPEIS